MWKIWMVSVCRNATCPYMTKCVYIYLLFKIKSAWKKESDAKWWKLQKLMGKKCIRRLKMVLILLWEFSTIALYWCIRAQGLTSLHCPCLISCMGLYRLRNPMGESDTILQAWDKNQLSSFLGGAVMLLVYEYTYSWLQENWWLPGKCWDHGYLLYRTMRRDYQLSWYDYKL